jgi:two-component system phosphate regulon response regulator PhoB
MQFSKPTVLLVEDEAVIRDLLRKFFERSNFAVLEAADGLEGLALAKERRPSVIITDQKMPNMSGVEMLKELRAYEETRSIPVVLATAYGKPCEDLVRHDIRTTVVPKPFLLSELLETVRSLAMVSGNSSGVASPVA